MAKHKQENNDYTPQHHTNAWLFSIKIGFFAGLIWGTIRWLFYEMKFTTELPGFAADPFFQEAFLKSFWGVLIGIGSFILISIAAALLYKVMLGRLRSPLPGIIYGLVWWAVIFMVIGPWLGVTERITKAGWNTLYTELCVFLLWGVFIGYSIAFEFTDEASREPVKAQ
ncbi:YqhR family membrane protein [Paenibacillus alkaliterrae]|uniref:YqhR family membrane protein n=1 Tax=Paenibacillus alkaliterrae TaxID=320909 RepID=UPI001F2644B6|nr:YqhR family membrane protein [Paenibacillus alkaliterrae]MCF2937492.1 YqhR family membrane protein [Paenibacillus alkaliterrae]